MIVRFVWFKYIVLGVYRKLIRTKLFSLILANIYGKRVVSDLFKKKL